MSGFPTEDFFALFLHGEQKKKKRNEDQISF